MAGQKPYLISGSETTSFGHFRKVRSARPQSILFGQAGFIIRQPVAVARGNSRASITRGWQPVPDGAAELGKVVKRVNVAKLTRVDQAHEYIDHLGSIQSPIKQGILSMQHGSF